MPTLPEPPSPNDTPNFETEADAFLGALPAWGQYIEALALTASTGAYKGTYSAGTAYGQGESVSYNGAVYVSLQAANTGHTPSSSAAWWENLIESKANRTNPVFAGGVSGPVYTTPAGFAFDCAQNSFFRKTCTGAHAISFTNVPPGSSVIRILLTNAGLGALTLPAGSKWANSTPPSFATSGTDDLVTVTDDGGSTWVWAPRAQAIG